MENGVEKKYTFSKEPDSSSNLAVEVLLFSAASNIECHLDHHWVGDRGRRDVHDRSGS